MHDNLDRDDSQCPYEHAIVFDEAQRAWNADQNHRKYRKRSSVWHVSEPEMVLRIMDRHSNWAVIIALVGGGQEIHHGEAGLSEWGEALHRNYRHWRVIVSPEALNGGESVAGTTLFSENYDNLDVIRKPALQKIIDNADAEPKYVFRAMEMLDAWVGITELKAEIARLTGEVEQLNTEVTRLTSAELREYCGQFRDLLAGAGLRTGKRT